MHANSPAGYHPEAVLVNSGHGEVALDPAPVVEHGGVGDLANRMVHLVGGDPLEEGECAPSLDLELGERGRVKNHHPFTGGPVLRLDDGRAVASRPAASDGLMATRQPLLVSLIPLRSLPAGCLEEDGTLLPESLVIRSEPEVARVLHLLKRVDDVVDLPVVLRPPLPDIGAAEDVRIKPVEVGLVQVKAGHTLGHPLGDHSAGAAAVCDPDRLCDPESAYIQRLAYQ